MSCPYDRRDFLKLGAVAGGLLVIPALQRKAHGAPPANAAIRRVLIVHLPGGLRSSAAFGASPDSIAHNPYGVIANTNTPFAFGKLLDDHIGAEAPLPADAYLLSQTGPWQGERVHRLRDIAPQVSVVSTWDDTRGDHIAARSLEPTGAYTTESAGILTRIHAGLVKRDGVAQVKVPPFQVNPSAQFGQAPGTLARYAPISLAGAGSLPGERTVDPEAARLTGHRWARDEDMLRRMDDRQFARRRLWSRALVEVFRTHHTAARRLGDDLSRPYLNVPREDLRAAALGEVRVGALTQPLTNAMLHELLVRTLGPDPADPARLRPLDTPAQHPLYEGAMQLALAVRLLQLDSSVACELFSWDTHSQELAAADQYRCLGRMLASLHWLLARIPERGEPGKSMLDRTLIVTTSDFGRDPPGPTGYNSGGGSDHGAMPACYSLAHFVDGPIVRGKWLGAVDTKTYDARKAPVRFSQKQLLATILGAIGLDPQDPEYGFEQTTPIAGLLA